MDTKGIRRHKMVDIGLYNILRLPAVMGKITSTSWSNLLLVYASWILVELLGGIDTGGISLNITIIG